MAYYSDQGAPIAQAVGEYFPGDRAPVAMAFKDGSFGRQLDETMPGPLMARGDGSLGNLRAFRDGSLGRAGRVRRSMRGMGEYFEGNAPKAAAYQDGSLGVLGGPLYVNGELVNEPMTLTHEGGVFTGGEGVTDGGTLGPGAANQGMEDEGLLTAWRDGILGNPPYVESMPGPLTSMYGGVVGRPPYVEAPPFTWPEPVSGVGFLRGLGRALGLGGDPNVVDLTDPATVKEVKTTLALAWPQAMSEEGVAVWDEAFYESAIWGPKASDLTNNWADHVVGLPDAPADLERGALVVTTPKGTYPSKYGLLVALSLGPMMYGTGIDFPAQFPILYPWFQAATRDPEAVALMPPHFTESERVEAEAGMGMKMSTVALVGLGAVGLIGAVIVLKGRKRR